MPRLVGRYPVLSVPKVDVEAAGRRLSWLVRRTVVVGLRVAEETEGVRLILLLVTAFTRLPVVLTLFTRLPVVTVPTRFEAKLPTEAFTLFTRALYLLSELPVATPLPTLLFPAEVTACLRTGVFTRPPTVAGLRLPAAIMRPPPPRVAPAE